MKKLYFILTVFFTAIGAFAQKNTVEIQGSTNVNSFKCINQSLPAPKVTVQSNKNFYLPDFKIPVDKFDCYNRIMTSNLKKTLKSDSFPYITIDFVSFTKNKNGKYGSWAEVKLMNRIKKYYFEFSLNNSQLTGSRIIKFSDFKIEPPKKMGGMIYVKDDINLVFRMQVNN